MIRMGRNSKTEQAEETPRYQEQTSNSGNVYQYSGNNLPAQSRAVSESESMARDIKEGRLSGFVGNGTVLTGETNFQAMLRVDGHLTGKVRSEAGTLIIGSTGRVDANINVAAAVVNGTVNGDIITTEKLELGRAARVVGNIQTPRLVIEDGAVLEGSCTMVKSKEAFEKRKADKLSPLTSGDHRSFETVEEEAEDFADSDDEETAEEAEAVSV